MLNKIVEVALRFRLLTVVALTLVLVLGVRAWLTLPVDAFPDVTPVQVSVTTESPGLAPEAVERLLTVPVESALSGLPGVRTIRSVSLFGLSAVTVYFADGTNIYFARRLVAEKLQEAKSRIPEGYGEPLLGPNASGLGQVFWYTVTAPDGKWSDMDLRTLQDWTIRLQLRTASGVDDINSWGGHEKQFQVLVDPRKLIKYGVSLRTVTEALLANNRQVGGQYVNLGSEQYLVNGVGLITNVEDLRRTPLAEADGGTVFVQDVAEIHEGGGLRFGAVTQDGQEVVAGIVLQRIGENARNVAAAIKDKLAIVQKALPAGVQVNPVYDRTKLVEQAVGTATRALVEGSVLVAIVLLLFLGELRSAIVVIVTLPLAMLIAFVLMQQAGVSANLMSLAGLAVGIGMMIDGAVVLVENAFRLLAHQRDPSISRAHLIRRAAAEVVKPVAFAILIIIVVFLPLFALSDIEGKLFRPMALSITFAMVGSLLLTMTAIPVLASFILKPRAEKDTLLVRYAKRGYLPLLDGALRHKRIVLAVALLMLVACAALIPFLGKEFIPDLQEGSLLFRVTTIPSSSLDETIAVSKQAEAVARQFPEVVTTLAFVGRAERGEPEDVNRVEMLVQLKDRGDWPNAKRYQDLAREMQDAMESALPTAVVSVSQPIQSRVEELVSGVRAPLALRIYGDDLAELERLAGALRVTLQRVPGVDDLSLESNRGKPQITVKVDRVEAARYGLSIDDVLEVVRTGIGGKAAGVVLDGTRQFDIQVWLQPEFRSSLAAIESLPLRTKEGALLPLSRVASIAAREGYAFIRHENLQRSVVLQMDVRGRDVGSFVAAAQAAIAREVKVPSGYVLDWGGSFENQQRALARLAVIVPITIGLIFILLYTAFDSAALASLIIANVPFALIGGVLALWLSGQYLSVPSAIGFIAVFGVAMLNGIVLVSFMNEQLERGKTVRDAVRDGALLRLRPVLMTASVTILGLLPMLLSQGVGAETQRPLATVVVGGLFSSTALTLLVLPLMYEWLASRQPRLARRRAPPEERP